MTQVTRLPWTPYACAGPLSQSRYVLCGRICVTCRHLPSKPRRLLDFQDDGMSDALMTPW